jgi:hypothetical protein
VGVSRWVTVGLAAVLQLGGAADAQTMGHTAVAYQRSGWWGGWADGATQEQAETAALEQCRALSGERCEIRYTRAVARALGPEGRVGIAISTDSRADARKRALDACHDPACWPVWTKSAPGFFVWFSPQQTAAEPVDFYLIDGVGSADAIMAKGKANCEAKTERPCQPVAFGAVRGRVAVDPPQASGVLHDAAHRP